MKVVILGGRMGTRLSEETDFVSKPMIEIGGKPFCSIQRKYMELKLLQPIFIAKPNEINNEQN